ncbi:MAG: hypothetical protein IKP21_07725 [Bacteroidales bacterium]|nr:hypothetical protein [Bacteroidales bacterium]
MKRTTIMLFAAMVVASVCLVGCKEGILGGGGGEEEELHGGFNSMGASYTVYSVAPGKRVHFSKGNLQHHPAFGAWRFAENQYDAVLDSNAFADEDYKSWIDLFGWGTSGWDGGAFAYQPWSTNNQDTSYCPGGDWTNGLFGPGENADWGMYNSIFGGGNQPKMWRTLKRDEWLYLIDTNEVRKDKFGFGVIGDKHFGLIILPDDWKKPAGLSFTASNGTDTCSELNHYSYNEWMKMDSVGAIFLPVSSMRNGKDVDAWDIDGHRFGYYWTASYEFTNTAYAFVFNNQGVMDNSTVKTDPRGRHYGMAVRLVRDEK